MNEINALSKICELLCYFTVEERGRMLNFIVSWHNSRGYKEPSFSRPIKAKRTRGKPPVAEESKRPSRNRKASVI